MGIEVANKYEHCLLIILLYGSHSIQQTIINGVVTAGVSVSAIDVEILKLGA